MPLTNPPIITKPLTIRELLNNVGESNFLDVIVPVDLGQAINSDEEGEAWLEYLDELVLPTAGDPDGDRYEIGPCTMSQSYEPVGFLDGKILLRFTAEIDITQHDAE